MISISAISTIKRIADLSLCSMPPERALRLRVFKELAQNGLGVRRANQRTAVFLF